MKKTSLLLVGSLFVMLASTHINAQILVTQTGAPNGTADVEHFGIGAEFSVGASDISVTALGAWGGAAIGSANETQFTLVGPTTAYLWDASSHSLLASVSFNDTTADATSASTVNGQGFIFGDLATPITLSAGHDYYITSDATNTGYVRIAPANYNVGSDITLIGSGFTSGSPSSFPDIDAGTPIPFGGNLEYTVIAAPEPSAWALVLVGLGAVAVVSRRRLGKI